MRPPEGCEQIRDMGTLQDPIHYAARDLRLAFERRHPGYSVLWYETYRSALRQAWLYRAGRFLAEIHEKANWYLEHLSRPDLARVLRNCPPNMGKRKLTGAGPGQSAHQYRIAADGVPVKGGKAIWDSDELWSSFGELANRQGFEWGGDWKFRDMPHVQDRGFSWSRRIEGFPIVDPITDNVEAA